MEQIILVLHIAAGAIAMVTGFTAMFVSKGTWVHRQSGNVFVVAMLVMGAGASILGYLQDSSGDLISGLLVAYLVSTAWLTVKRKLDTVGAFEVGAFLVVLVGMAVSLFGVYMASTNGTGRFNGSPLAVNAIGAVVLGLMAIGDLNNIRRRGLRGKARLARHLWRMCFAVFVAAGPIFIARIHVFPDFLSATAGKYLLFAIPFVPIVVIFYWLVWLRFSRWYERRKSGLIVSA